MPRVINFLRVQGEMAEAERVFAAIADDAAGIGSIDFNKITPMPRWVYRGPADEAAYRTYGRENCWPDWRQKNWQINWNAIEGKTSARAYDGGDTIRFITRDKPVPGLMERLSRIYPAVYLDYLWAAEDVDRGAGALQFKNGETTLRYLPPPGSRGGYELAFDILRTTPAEHGLVLDKASGNYRLKGGFANGRTGD